MKFMAAKCPNCGAKIKMKKGEKFYTCDYCKYDIIFDDAGNFDTDKMNLEGIDLNKFQKVFKVVFIIPIIIFLIIFISSIFLISNIMFSNNVSTSSYNIFIDTNGICMGTAVASMLESAISNMEEYDTEITVSYLGEETTDIDKIKEFIIELDTNTFKNYTVLTYKDSDGYVDTIKISE